MVVNAPDAPVQAEVIFVIEATSANGAYINELKTNYIVPTLEFFHGGALEEGGGSGSVYSVITYKAADCLPGLPVSTYGPFTSPQNVIETVDRLQFIGGHAESKACVTEALVTAAACFEELARTDIPRHVLLLCCSPPYSAYAGGLVPPGCPGTIEQAARLLGERGIQLSVAGARRITALHSLYEHAGGDLHQAQQRNYAKDPRHLVLLRGYSLKERPPSPAPPPAPDMQQPDVYGQGRGAGGVGRGGGTGAFPRAAGQVGPVGVTPPVGVVGGAAAGAVPRGYALPASRPHYQSNSVLLSQLAQPPYPPPPPQAGMPRMPGMGPVTGPTPGPSSVQNTGQAPGMPQRNYIWSGVLEWMEKGKNPGDTQKTTKILPCQVSAGSKDIEPDLKVDTWPNKLLMQLMPKQLVGTIGGQYLRDSKSVLFHLQQNEAVEALTKVMINGFAGCVHFSPMSSTSQCDIRVLILLYTPEKKAYLGFIPNNQATFVERLRKVIQQQKITQIINKQLPNGASGSAGMPTPNMAGSSGMPSGSMSSSMGAAGMGGADMGGAGMGGPGMGGAMGAGVGQMNVPSGRGMVPQMQQHPQGMMMSSGIGGQLPGAGGKGPRPVPQLDGLEAARQKNLETIQHLQQTLEAAQQQEAQFKSQMDIMTHLHAAQQQEQHFKQLDEQRKHQQLQQQLQQQLRVSPRIMRPIMPSNPGLRHLLQQQPQYRPGGGAPRPPSQPQQFEDVNNYDFM